MNKITGLFAALLLFTACNTREKEHATENANIDTREKSMQDAIEKFPDSLLLKEDLAQYYRDNGSYDRALALINKAIDKDSNNAHLWDIKGTLHFEDDDTLGAIRAYERAVQIIPDPVLVMTLGSLYAQTKDARALKMAELLINNKKGGAEKEGIFLKGLYYSYAGDKKKAISFFDNSLSMDYTFMLAYREKGIALYDMGKYAEALDVLNKGITVQHNFDEGYYWMGRCLEKLNRTAEAIESYQTALQYDPDFIEAKDALGKLGVH